MISNGNELALESKRISFGKTKFPAEYPDFLEIQLKSFQEFFQLETTPENRMNEGLYKVFKENFPISDARSIFQLEFLDYFVDPPRYSMEECVQRGLTFHVPLKAKLKLSCNDVEHVDFQTIVQDVFLGNIPYMTPRGTFVINGAERVVVSQLHRSPGVFFGQSVHPNGTKIYSARVIPFKGAWMEFATDINISEVVFIKHKDTSVPNAQWLKDDDKCFHRIYEVDAWDDDDSNDSWDSLQKHVPSMMQHLTHVTRRGSVHVLICDPTGNSTCIAVFLAYMLMSKQIRTDDSLKNCTTERHSVQVSLSLLRGIENIQRMYDDKKMKRLKAKLRNATILSTSF